ncbi:MAG: methyltransferase domain-containing protein [Blastocatellia bacterium]
MKKSEVEYIGKDLESMDFAENYHRWILELFKPFLGRSFVEVGAGTGSFSKLLLETNPESLVLVEPSEMFDSLTGNFPSETAYSKIHLIRNIFANAHETIRENHSPDTIFYINVLEHIEDDVFELKLVQETLFYGGRLCIFVPAIPFLLSDFDRQIGHFRRYRRKELIEKCVKAGFRIRFARGFDFPGIVPWFLKYRLMRSLTLESGAVAFYDKIAVPFIRPIENFLRPMIGKNLIVVAEKN